MLARQSSERNTAMLDGNTAALRQQEDLWDEQYDATELTELDEGSELIDLAVEILIDLANEQPFCALTEAKQRYHDPIRYAAEWDEFVATCSASEARNAVLDNCTPPHVRKQLREEFD
jgi:hypothetical protein